MPTVAITQLATTSGAFAALTNSGTTGAKRVIVTIVADHALTTATNNAVETLLKGATAGTSYTFYDVPDQLFFKSVAATGVVNAYMIT